MLVWKRPFDLSIHGEKNSVFQLKFTFTLTKGLNSSTEITFYYVKMFSLIFIDLTLLVAFYSKTEFYNLITLENADIWSRAVCMVSFLDLVIRSMFVS